MAEKLDPSKSSPSPSSATANFTVVTRSKSTTSRRGKRNKDESASPKGRHTQGRNTMPSPDTVMGVTLSPKSEKSSTQSSVAGASDGPASATQNSEKKSPAIKMVTRQKSKRSDESLRKSKRMRSSPQKIEVAEEEDSGTLHAEDTPKVSIDDMACMLAELDCDSHRAAVMSDATQILERIILPASFPWNHQGPGMPIAKNIPCDLDEMPDILCCEEEGPMRFANGPLDFGRFDTGQTRTGASKARLVNSEYPVRYAARRTTDVGVTELRMIDVESALEPDWEDEECAPMPESAGGPTLACYNHCEMLKQQRMGKAESLLASKSISVRVGSSSSRKSILDEYERTDLLDVLYPSEVQTGRFLTTKRAKGIAESLGSYDVRHGLPPTNPSGRNSNRISVGRTRLVWSKKSPHTQPQRVYFTSTLSSERLERGASARPREAKLGLKLYGQRLNETMVEDRPRRRQRAAPKRYRRNSY